MTDSDTSTKALLSTCRDLMRCILTMSRREEDCESVNARVRAAQGFVQEAVNTLDSAHEDPSIASLGSLNRLAATLTTQLVQDLLVADEQRSAEEADRGIATKHERDGFHGYAWMISVPDLMGFLQVQQKSGALRVNIGTELISLIFDSGDLIHAWSDNSPPGMRLGEILVNQESIGVKELEQFLLRAGSMSIRLGDAMEQEGLITRDQLRNALDHQVQGIFQRLFAAPDAYYTFREGHSESVIADRRNVLELLLETCRVSDEASGSSEGER